MPHQTLVGTNSHIVLYFDTGFSPPPPNYLCSYDFLLWLLDHHHVGLLLLLLLRWVGGRGVSLVARLGSWLRRVSWLGSWLGRVVA